MKMRRVVSVAAVITVIGLLVVPLVYRTRMTTMTPDITPMPHSDNSTYIHALVQRASPDRYIILALVDAAFVDMAVNLYETSLRPNSIDNFLFVGVGRRACDLMRSSARSNPLPCYHYADDAASDTASIYRSSDFIRKMNIRTDMIIEALNAGFTVVHTDLDVVFLHNPLPHLKVWAVMAYVLVNTTNMVYNYKCVYCVSHLIAYQNVSSGLNKTLQGLLCRAEHQSIGLVIETVENMRSV